MMSVTELVRVFSDSAAFEIWSDWHLAWQFMLWVLLLSCVLKKALMRPPTVEIPKIWILSSRHFVTWTLDRQTDQTETQSRQEGLDNSKRRWVQLKRHTISRFTWWARLPVLRFVLGFVPKIFPFKERWRQFAGSDDLYVKYTLTYGSDWDIIGVSFFLKGVGS